MTIEGEERVLVLVRDLSDQERLQQELVQAQKMEAIGLLVAGVAHELNNPLAAIVGFSQLLRADPRLPADMKSMADQLIDQTDRTRRIVGGLLDFARQRPPERHPTPIRPLIQSVIDLQSYSYTAGRITVEVDISPDVPHVALDRSQIQQVLLNLTLNAVQAIGAARDHGTLRISAAPNGATGPQRPDRDRGRRERASRRRIEPACSCRSSRPRGPARGRAWGSRCRRASSSRTAGACGTSRWTAAAAGS